MQTALTKRNLSLPQKTHTQRAPSADNQDRASTPNSVEDSPYFDAFTPVDQVSPKGGRVFKNMMQAKLALDSLEFQELDPYVATVAGGTSTRSAKNPKKAQKIKLSLPEYYEKKFEVEMGLQNGPDAPMLVILPGIYGERSGGYNTLFKEMAHVRGMNYLVVPNALGDDALDDRPLQHPGNPGLEAQVVTDILKTLKNHSPEHFKEVSIAGYSYGGLLAANVVRRDEEQNSSEDRLITGGMVTVAPPEDLHDSMQELDGLRHKYAKGAGSMIACGLKYRKEVKKFGYYRFPESEVAKHGPGTNITEIKMADHYGSRKSMKSMVARIDRMFGHNKIPRRDVKDPGKGEERKQILDAMNYQWYSQDWFAKDSWLVERGLTPEKMADEFSYKRALDIIEDTPVLNLVAADDYILNSENVKTYKELEKNEQGLEKTKITEFGGHVGVLFHPEARHTLTDFLYSTAKHPENFKDA